MINRHLGKSCEMICKQNSAKPGCNEVDKVLKFSVTCRFSLQAGVELRLSREGSRNEAKMLDNSELAVHEFTSQ